MRGLEQSEGSKHRVSGKRRSVAIFPRVPRMLTCSAGCRRSRGIDAVSLSVFLVKATPKTVTSTLQAKLQEESTSWLFVRPSQSLSPLYSLVCQGTHTSSCRPTHSPECCICAGLLFTHWIADSLTLWRTPVTDAHLWVAARYYHVLTKGTPAIGYVVAAAAMLGAATILWSLRDGEAGNLMFDGGSICALFSFSLHFLYGNTRLVDPDIVLYGTAIAIYIQSVLPSTFNLMQRVIYRLLT